MYAFLAYFGLLMMNMCDMAETITMKAGTLGYQAPKQPKSELSVIYMSLVKC